MGKAILFFCAVLVGSCHHSINATNESSKTQDNGWKIGAKMHFESDSGNGYLGLKEIHKLTKAALVSALSIHIDTCQECTKILLKKEGDKILMTHYEEKSRPGVGEELHATLLYTSPRGFYDSETLHQVCGILFKDCTTPPSLESVAKEYSEIVKTDWTFKILEVVLTHDNGGRSFIMAKLLLNERENIYKGASPISAGLHMAFVNCADNILSDPAVSAGIIKNLNEKLKGKMIKVATKNGVVDLEFGMSGQPWRIRAGIRFDI